MPLLHTFRVQRGLAQELFSTCRFYLSLDNDRELEGKCRALARLQLDPDFAAVHLNDALRYSEPQAGATFFAGDRVVGLLKLLKQHRLIVSGDSRSGVADRDMECAIISFRIDRDFARIGELNRVADEIDQNLRQAAAITMTGRQLAGKLKLECELLIGRQRLQRAADGLGNVLNAVIG